MKRHPWITTSLSQSHNGPRWLLFQRLVNLSKIHCLRRKVKIQRIPSCSKLQFFAVGRMVQYNVVLRSDSVSDKSIVAALFVHYVKHSSRVASNYVTICIINRYTFSTGCEQLSAFTNNVFDVNIDFKIKFRKPFLKINVTLI